MSGNPPATKNFAPAPAWMNHTENTHSPWPWDTSPRHALALFAGFCKRLP